MFIHIFTRGRLPRSVSSPSSCLMYVDSDKDLLCMRILAHAMWEEDCWAPGKLHLIPPKPVVTSFITPERTGGKRGTTAQCYCTTEADAIFTMEQHHLVSSRF